MAQSYSSVLGGGAVAGQNRRVTTRQGDAADGNRGGKHYRKKGMAGLFFSS
jgi:hypothetical protein